jgi:hypothetical protein
MATTRTKSSDDVKPVSFEDAVEGVSTALVAQEQEEEGSFTPVAYSTNPDLEGDEVAYPRLRLAQQLTPEVVEQQAQMGDYVCTGYEAQKSVTFVPVLFGRSRKRVIKDTGGNNETTCFSTDGKTGRGDNGTGVTGVHDCSTCPAAMWGARDPVTKKGAPPTCGKSFRYVGYAKELDAIVELVLARTGMNAATTLNTMIKSRGLGNFSVRLGSTRQTNDRRQQYAVPTVFPMQRDDELLSSARLMITGGVAEDGPDAE